MSYHPETASNEEKWNFRERLLNDYLDEIPFTTTQRRMIDHHIAELRKVFDEAKPTVVLDASKRPLL